jgi:PilZ domain
LRRVCPALKNKSSVVLNSRNSERVYLSSTEARLRETAGSSWPVRLIDLSPRGFRAAWHYSLKAGDRVWLKIGDMEALCALVRWNREFEIGCEFEHPIHPAVFDHIVRQRA